MMIYRPNYCSHCGENVERFEWKIWTSTRFCETCENDFKIQDWFPRGILGISVLGMVFGLGNYLKQPEKNIQITANELPIASTKEVKDSFNKQLEIQVSENKVIAKTEPKTLVSEIKSQKTEPQQEVGTFSKQKELSITAAQIVQKEPTEIVYFCGAKTKKGTPCSRKVKAPERCWQHFGQETQISQEKLKIKP
jgi:hypothetical protein